MAVTEHEIDTLRDQVAAQQRQIEGLRAALADRPWESSVTAGGPREPAENAQALQARLVELAAQRDRLQQSLEALLGSREWRLLHVLRRIRQRLAPYGSRRARWIWFATDVLLRRPKHVRGQPGARVSHAAGAFASPIEELRSILDVHTQRRGIVVHPALTDWDWMKQRPHHLLGEFARAGYLVFFCPPQVRTDLVPTFTRVAERLYLCGDIEWLFDLPEPIVLLSKPQDGATARRFREPAIIYDYLDDLIVHSPTGRVDRRTLREHQTLLQTATVVCATSQPLVEQARQTRADVLTCPNAADFDHFHLAAAPPIPPDLEPFVAQGRPIIGYYGALAAWFDFELLHQIAARCPEYNFILIGPDYEGALRSQAATSLPNVRWLGEKRYEDLPAYLHYFDVATIPFRVNALTRATSPIKLFEYLAAGKPVVTTSLPECARHECVLTAADAGQFVARLAEALRCKDDPELRRARVQVARENSWGARFAALHSRLVPDNVLSLEDVLAKLAGRRGAVVFPRSIDWNVDLFQRPHHLARYFARRGYVSIYAGGSRDGRYDGFHEVEPNVFVFRGPEPVLAKVPDPLLWCFCYNFDRVDRFPPGTRAVYDLIDEPAVHPFKRRFLGRNHRRALREATLVTYVAHALEPLLRGRPDALYLPNGVEDDHFADPDVAPLTDPELDALRSAGLPIAGYYGALATWFDYELLAQVARQRPDWGFLLIGPDYDGSLLRQTGLRRPNVWRLGPRPYAALPAYLRLFDVAMIPFRINKITRATSPLKLFEYFAGGKPVVTTSMPECQAWPEVRIAANAAEFSAALDVARAAGQDPAVRQRLRETARQNSWLQRVQAVEERLCGADKVAAQPRAGGTPP